MADHGTIWTSSKIREHEDQRSQVRPNTDHSLPNLVINGVKQDCVLTPTLFTIFFSMMLKWDTEDLDNGEGVYIINRLDGSLFNFRQLQAHTNTLATDPRPQLCR